jgi:NADH-quinone oxidoreductase subunit D
VSELLETDVHETLVREEVELSFGPQHPAIHGLLRLKVKMDGERIAASSPIIGHLHRGIEKVFEAQPYLQNVRHTGRLDFVAAATSNLA